MATRKTPAAHPAPAAAAAPSARPARKTAPAPTANVAPSVSAQVAPTVTAKAAPAAAAAARPIPAPAAADKPRKADKPKKAPKVRPVLVRDSFTLPEADFALIGTLKARALAGRREAKKSELLRAGLQALAAMDSKALLAALNALEPIKTGRPKKA